MWTSLALAAYFICLVRAASTHFYAFTNEGSRSSFSIGGLKESGAFPASLTGDNVAVYGAYGEDLLILGSNEEIGSVAGLSPLRATTSATTEQALVVLQREKFDVESRAEEEAAALAWQQEALHLLFTRGQYLDAQVVYAHPSLRAPTHFVVSLPRKNIYQFDAFSATTRLFHVSEEPIAPAEGLPASHPVMQLLQKRFELHNAEVESTLALLDEAEQSTFVTYLTGESSDVKTRHSQSGSEINTVASHIAEHFKQNGCDNVEKMVWRQGWGPNVICTRNGTKYSNKYIIISAHYDDRERNIYRPGLRAPGADDDASGTSMIMEIARVLNTANVQSDYTLKLITFSGEEQGLFGSKALAKKMSAEIAEDSEAEIVIMIQGDMLAYHKKGEPMQLGFPTKYSTKELDKLFGVITSAYVPELEIGVTPGCCSDHQSFWERGFPSTQFFERNGNIADPMYHNVGDVSAREGYDFHQLHLITKAMLACLLTVAWHSRILEAAPEVAADPYAGDQEQNNERVTPHLEF